jgi:hypothetical protein
MELLEGESLERRLEKCPLTLMQALQCGIQIAEALANTDIGESSHAINVVVNWTAGLKK